jgi:transposase
MFVRKRKNKSGTVSVQIIEKVSGKYRVVKHIGTSSDQTVVNHLMQLAAAQMVSLDQMRLLDVPKASPWGERLQVVSNISTGHLEVFGQIYDEIGYNVVIPGELVKLLTIARIAHPHSKLSVSRWLDRKLGVKVSEDKIYRLMDTLGKEQERAISDHTYNFFRKVVGEKIHMIFFDATTLHFETFVEDSFRKTGFSKAGKHNQPQIVVGLMVTREGLPIGYDVFPGNQFDGYTIRSVLSRVSRRYGTDNIVFVADAGMLSKQNIKLIEDAGFQYIMAARIKNFNHEITDMILDPANYKDDIWEYELVRGRLVMSYSEERARKDMVDRERNIEQVKRKLTRKQKITRSKVGKIGKSKYLLVTGDAEVSINYQAIREDGKWDGLKGYITNIPRKQLPAAEVIGKYTELWQVEKAFRISKGDLQMRPIFHYKRERVRAHILLVFMSLAVLRYTEIRLKSLGISGSRLVESLDAAISLRMLDRFSGLEFDLRPGLSDVNAKVYEILQIKSP